jgi:hypothetical protein
VPASQLGQASTTVGEVEKQLLNAYVHLDRSGDIEEIRLRGSAVRSIDNAQFAQQVQAHEEWSQADVLKQLRAAGASAVDRQQVIARLPLAAWKPLFGVLKVRDVKFSDPAVRQTKTERGEAYIWDVLLDSSARPARRYAITVEPFGGSVKAVVKTAPDFLLK